MNDDGPKPRFGPDLPPTQGPQPPKDSGLIDGKMGQLLIPRRPEDAPFVAIDAEAKSVEELKALGNDALKKGRLTPKTEAGRQFFQESEKCYRLALQKLAAEPVEGRQTKTQELQAQLYGNLAMVCLDAEKFSDAKAAADAALKIAGTHHSKAYFRRAKALLENNRADLPEEALLAALADFDSACEKDPQNKAIKHERATLQKRLDELAEARRVPEALEIATRFADPELLVRGGHRLPQGYSWGQTEKQVHVYVPVRGVRLEKPGDCTVEISEETLRIVIPEKGGTSFEVSGQLSKVVLPDESSWRLEATNLLLHVVLAKQDDSREGEHWVCVYAGHPEALVPTGAQRRAQLDKEAKELQAKEEREFQRWNVLEDMNKISSQLKVEYGCDAQVDPYQNLRFMQ